MKKNRFLKWAGGNTPCLTILKAFAARRVPDRAFRGRRVGISQYRLFSLYSGGYQQRPDQPHIVKLRPMSMSAAREMFTPENNQAERTISSARNLTSGIRSACVLFLYLNRHGYNGLCRYNLRGEFNVPFGRYKKPYFPEAELYHFAEKAQNAGSIASPMKSAWTVRITTRWSIATRLMRRCRRRRISPRITPTALARRAGPSGGDGGKAGQQADPGVNFEPRHARYARMVQSGETFSGQSAAQHQQQRRHT
jgi:DNA adenine methylase